MPGAIHSSWLAGTNMDLVRDPVKSQQSHVGLVCKFLHEPCWGLGVVIAIGMKLV